MFGNFQYCRIRVKYFYILFTHNKHTIWGGEGAEIIYALRNNDTFSKLINKNLEDIGRDVRKYYQRRLPSNPSKDYYFILRDTPDIEAVIVEYGFLDNQKDANLLKNNYEDYAEAIVKSIAEYLGVKYVAPTNLNGDYYIVEKGDTLYNIAKKFNTTVDNLKLMNNLKSNLLSIGQKLIIKNNNKQTNDMDNMTYQVVKGDTLYQLAKRFNTTVDELKRLNNLTSNTLSIGQVLKLPSKYYIVKKGDTLYSISKANNTTVNNIIEKNGLKSTTLSIGQQLIL